jgi:cell division protein FtsB
MATVTQARVRYEDDLFAWTQEQAALLRAHAVDGIDWENLAEEIESMGGRDRRKLESRLTVILSHLLKWQAQPALRGASWRKTLRTQRREIRKLLKQSPSLRREVPDMIREAYADAVKDAIDETGLRANIFPTACPYMPEDVLDEDHLPATDL